MICKIPPMIKRITLVTLWISILLSCRVMLVPEYSAKLEEDIAKTAKANDKLYIDLLDAAPAKRVYENYKERYADIEADINAIRLKNEARNKNEDFLVIIDNLKKGFTEAKKYHKDNNTLADGEIMAYQATLAGLWKPLYLAERSLKINDKK
jgi:hypothetical protein